MPGWLGKYAILDDDALAALGNRGLVRRAHKRPVEVVSVTEDKIILSCPPVAGGSPTMITLTAAGPTAVRCDCPVAGICIHVIAAALWVREHFTAPTDTEVVEVDVVDEVLTWDPAVVNRAVGIAAVRALVGAKLDDSVEAVQRAGSTATISWPGSPKIVFTAGAGVGGMIISGQHTDAARKRWQLEAVIRLWHSRGRPWEWPDAVIDDGSLQPGERAAAGLALEKIEGLIDQGLAHLGGDSAGQLRGAGERAKLEDLGLLSRLLGQAAAQVGRLADHRDDSDEIASVAALARAWALATALLGSNGEVSDDLRGVRSDAPAEVGRLVPLGVRWWDGANGSRGLTAHWWDVDHGRLETLTTGRAAGVDRSFGPSWDVPLVWGASAQRLSAGPLTLAGAERREDGRLSPTTRTTIRRTDTWSGIDLDRLIDDVNRAAADPAMIGFAGAPPRLRILRPTRGHELMLDEVRQQIVWQLAPRRFAERSEPGIELRLDADSMAARRLMWVLARKDPIHGVVVGDGDRPDALIIGKPPSVVSLTLTPIPQRDESQRVRQRAERLGDYRRSDPDRPSKLSDPIVQLARSINDVVVSLAVTGRAQPSPRQRQSLEHRIDQAETLGLSSVVAVARPLLITVTPAVLLRAAFVLDRLLLISAIDDQTG